MEKEKAEQLNIYTDCADEEEIDLRDLFFMLVSKIKWIILIAVAGGILGALITALFIAPKYKATSKIYIVSASNDSVINLSDLQLGTSLTSDYKELLLSRPMLESIIENLDLQTSCEMLKSSIEVVNPSGTRILEITATSTNPELARDIANEMATLSKNWLSEIMDSRQPNIVERAVTPAKKSSPSLVKYTMAGALGLAALYCAVIVVMYLMDDTIHSSEEFEKYFGIVPMAVIPEVESISDEKEKKVDIKGFVNKEKLSNIHANLSNKIKAQKGGKGKHE